MELFFKVWNFWLPQKFFKDKKQTSNTKKITVNQYKLNCAIYSRGYPLWLGWHLLVYLLWVITVMITTGAPWPLTPEEKTQWQEPYLYVESKCLITDEDNAKARCCKYWINQTLSEQNDISHDQVSVILSQKNSQNKRWTAPRIPHFKLPVRKFSFCIQQTKRVTVKWQESKKKCLQNEACLKKIL